MLIACPVCCEIYDEKHHEPLVHQCGHTLCDSCSQEMIQCPNCMKTLYYFATIQNCSVLDFVRLRAVLRARALARLADGHGGRGEDGKDDKNGNDNDNNNGTDNNNGNNNGNDNGYGFRPSRKRKAVSFFPGIIPFVTPKRKKRDENQ